MMVSAPGAAGHRYQTVRDRIVVRRRGAHRDQQQHSGQRRRPGQEPEQVTGRSVDPLQVVNKQADHAIRGQRQQQRVHATEQCSTVQIRRRPDTRSGQVGMKQRQPRCVPTGRLDHGPGTKLGNQGAQHLPGHPIGHLLAYQLHSVAGRHQIPSLTQLVQKLGGQPGLPDTRLALHHNRARGPGPGILNCPAQSRELLASPDQPFAAPSHHPTIITERPPVVARSLATLEVMEPLGGARPRSGEGASLWAGWVTPRPARPCVSGDRPGGSSEARLRLPGLPRRATQSVSPRKALEEPQGRSESASWPSAAVAHLRAPRQPEPRTHRIPVGRRPSRVTSSVQSAGREVMHVRPHAAERRLGLLGVCWEFSRCWRHRRKPLSCVSAGQGPSTEPPVGIEPTTFSLRVRRSTD